MPEIKQDGKKTLGETIGFPGAKKAAEMKDEKKSGGGFFEAVKRRISGGNPVTAGPTGSRDKYR